MLDANYSVPDGAVAIIGMAGQFPGARTVTEFWQNLIRSVKSIQTLSDEDLAAMGVPQELRNNSDYVKKASTLADIELFDAAFFGFTPREAESVDPQTRLFLQCAWTALEDAGYNPETYDGLIGTFAGKGFPLYMWRNLATNPEFVQLVGELQVNIHNENDSLAPIVAYRMDLKGPSVSVQSFCSTSMLAIHLAYQSLSAFECDMAIAGGAAITSLPQGAGYLYQEGGIVSPDGECRSFDANANGSIMGSGVGAVVLKRLEDALEDRDHIYAVIRGSATNNDGIMRVGYTAPGLNGQAAVISEALGVAGTKAETISYIETHGTGTPLGDSIELAAMMQAFALQTDQKGFCAIGSVKPNVGHLDRASGVANLIKASLALHHKLLPPSLNFEKPNPEIELENSPFYVNTTLQPWRTNGNWPRRAGVSSFGLGGTNVHLVLEEAPPSSPSSAARPYQPLLFSAKTEGALEVMTSNLADYLQQNPESNLADIAFTLQVGRVAFNHRRMVVCTDSQDGARALSLADPQRVLTANQTFRERPVVFMFPGVGDHYVGMAQELYQTEPVFREWVDTCCDILQSLLGIDLRDVLYPQRDKPIPKQSLAQIKPNLRGMLSQQYQDTQANPLSQTILAQPAMFVVEYALAQLLMSWGIQPAAMIGYSLGEYTAACLADVLSLPDALMLVARRAQLIERLDKGSMLTVALPASDVYSFLDDGISLAGELTPTTCVLAGPPLAIATLQERLTAKDIVCRPLPTTHAFHSTMMTPIIGDLAALLQTITLNPPKIPYVSNVTGNWITDAEATDPAYWTRHLCQPVQFAAGTKTLLQTSEQFFLELGPGQALGSFVKQHPACKPEQRQLMASMLPHAYDNMPAVAFALSTLGRMWLAGVEVDWGGFYQHEARQRLSLPTYPFARLRYWIEAKEGASFNAATASPLPATATRKKADMADWFYKPVWRVTELPPMPAQQVAQTRWLLFDADNGLGEQLVARVAQKGGTAIRVIASEQFAQLSDALFSIRPNQPADYFSLIRTLKTLNQIPEKIVHLWNTSPAHPPTLHGAARFTAAQPYGFYSLIYLAQALSEQNINDPLEIVAISANAQPVMDTEAPYPERATILGACRAILQEGLTMTCRTIDIDEASLHAALPKAAATLFAELTTPSTDLETAYRRGTRFTREYKPMRLEKQPHSALRHKGTYLITGGLGGVGLILSEYLSQTYQANLVLVGHSPLPPREKWADWLDSHNKTDVTSHRIRRIQAIEAKGGRVFFGQADVANKAQMEQVITEAVAQFGKIDGVLHAAGISDSRAFDSIQRIRPRQCEWHFQPKIYGLYVLDELLSDQKLDFFMLFSSLSSVLGGLTFTAYTAANIFMDAFTYQHNRTAQTKWISVNWDTWRVSANQHEILGKTVAEYEMSPAEGAEVFERILANPVDTHIVESTGDLEERIRQWIKLESLRSEQTTTTSGSARPNLGTTYQPATNEYEEKIAQVWQELLGINKIGIHDNFFDLGGNSLIGLQVIARLKKVFDMQIPVVALFEAPTVSTLARYLQPEQSEPEEDLQQLRLTERRKQARVTIGDSDIAIVGMAGKFPGANDVQTFWENLCNGVESITFFSDEELKASSIPEKVLQDERYVKARPILSDPGLFDASFFGYSPREAELTDPQHRLFLECAWQALEVAGYDPLNYPGLISVFGGTNVSFYVRQIMNDPNIMATLGEYESSYQLAVGNDIDSLTTTVSYKLNLKGPSLSVQTFCSTSLVSTHLACQSLLQGECDMALAGGVSVRVPVKAGHIYVKGGMESPDGHCRTFDAQADGTLFGDAVGIVVLKRLEDALDDGDAIYGVIKGTAINNDGLMKVGYTAPGVEGQTNVIATALENAGLSAESIGYIEAHGTATQLGDPIEVTALSKAFRLTTEKRQYCPIGSLKTNMGHLDRASGVAGLIKTTLIVKNGLIPPSLHFEKPNPEIDFANSPFYVNTKLTKWLRNGAPRRAGVSSLGMGGTNAHVIVEEPPHRTVSGPSRPWQLLLLSARSETALDKATANLTSYLRQNPDANLPDMAFTLQVGRHPFEHRRMVVVKDSNDALEMLESLNPRRLFSHYQPAINRQIIFMFPGVGDHYLQMGRDLYEGEPLFREIIEQCSQILYPYLGAELVDLLYPPQKPDGPSPNGDKGYDLRAMLRRNGQETSPAAQQLYETVLAQPVTFVIEYALARLIMSWGIQPQALIGYSLGEYVAACLAGVLSLEDALRLVAERAQMIQNLPSGQMLAVSLSKEQVQSFLNEEISLAAHVGKSTFVLAGAPEAIARLQTQLDKQEIAARLLDTTHAFHSHMMLPLTGRLTDLVDMVTLNPPRVPYLSNVTGTWITEDQATDPDYWAQHMCQPVEFFDSLTAALKNKDTVLLEVGPGQALASFVKQHPGCSREQLSLVLPTMPYAYDRQSSLPFLLGTIGKLWLLGIEPNWNNFYNEETRHRLALPTYPFDYHMYWLEGRPQTGQVVATKTERQPLEDWFYLPTWNQTPPHDPAALPLDTCWLLFTDKHGLGNQLAGWLQARQQPVVVVEAGNAFAQLNTRHFVLRPAEFTDYGMLISHLIEQQLTPTNIVHMWGISAESPAAISDNTAEWALQQGLYSLIGLAKAMGEMDLSSYQLSVIVSRAFRVTGNDIVSAIQAAIAGPCKVIPQEYPLVPCRLIDVAVEEPGSWQAQALFNNLLGELTAADFSDRTVALRNDQRWVQTFAGMKLPQRSADKPSRLRPHGVYLITGGLGGIGLAMAEYLAQEVQARLVLLGRSRLPDRTAWPDILATSGDESGIGRKIAQVQHLEALGAEVMVIAADVSNETEMTEALQQVLAHFGEIHGIIHAAGLPGIGIMQVKTMAAITAVLAPKIMGTLALERVCKDLNLDFLALFSSISSVTGGGPGQVDYAAANAFLDAYAWQQVGCRQKTISIGWNEWQWNAWQEGLEGFGAEVQQAFQANRQRYGISFNEGQEAFARVLARGMPHVIVSPPDFHDVIKGSLTFTVETILEMGRQERQARPKYPRPALGTSYAAPRNDMERTIAAVWEDILGISEIGINDNFFDLGGNSLVGIDLANRLKKELNIAKIPAHVLYEAPSISELAKYLDQDHEEKNISFTERLERGSKRRQAAQRRVRK